MYKMVNSTDFNKRVRAINESNRYTDRKHRGFKYVGKRGSALTRSNRNPFYKPPQRKRKKGGLGGLVLG